MAIVNVIHSRSKHLNTYCTCYIVFDLTIHSLKLGFMGHPGSTPLGILSTHTIF